MAGEKNRGAANSAALPPEQVNGTEAQATQAVPQPDTQQQVPAAGGMDMMMGMMDRFMSMMERRDQAMREEMDRRLETVLRATNPTKLSVEERPAQSAVEDAELAPYYDSTGGLIQPPRATGNQRRNMARMVAFIPKEDPFNPKMTIFKGWLNGREVRIRRGQVGMVSRGVGVDWARNKHGHVVDIAAMQGLGGQVNPEPIKTTPDFNLPDNWDGRPLSDQSTFDARRFA